MTAGPTPRYVEWRSYRGHVPALCPHAVTRAALTHSARFELLLTKALPPPYGQHAGAVWTYWNLLAAVSVRPLPRAFNTSAPGLVRLFEGAAAAVQTRARQLFGEDFFGSAQVVEVTNRFPTFLGAALLDGLGGTGEARALSADTVARVEREAAEVLQQRRQPPEAEGGAAGAGGAATGVIGMRSSTLGS